MVTTHRRVRYKLAEHILAHTLPACSLTGTPASPTHAAHALQLGVDLAEPPGTLRGIVVVGPNALVLLRQLQQGAAVQRLLDLAQQAAQLGAVLSQGGHCRTGEGRQKDGSSAVCG